VTVIRGEKIEALNQRIALLQAQLENLLETFTANHPQVRRARAALAALELQQQREQPDPADQQKELQSMLEQLDADMQRLNRTIKPAPQHFTVSTPQPISQSEPQYTAEAKAARIQGTVELSITIGIDGSVQDAKVVRSLDPGLDRQAIECVKLWRYTPMTLDGEKVAATMNVAVTFRIP
jgi:TonB family protein